MNIEEKYPDIHKGDIISSTDGIVGAFRSWEKDDMGNDCWACIYANNIDDNICSNSLFRATIPIRKANEKEMLRFQSKLKKNGYVYFVTDWQEYADFALEELNATESLKNKYDGFAEHQTWRPETKFERKGLNADRVINELFFEKI